MNVTYSYMRPLEADKTTLAEAGNTAIIDTKGRSAVIKAVSGSAYICGGGSPISTDCYILGKDETLCFCGRLKLMAKEASFDARVLYFDSI